MKGKMVLILRCSYFQVDMQKTDLKIIGLNHEMLVILWSLSEVCLYLRRKVWYSFKLSIYYLKNLNKITSKSVRIMCLLYILMCKENINAQNKDWYENITQKCTEQGPILCNTLHLLSFNCLDLGLLVQIVLYFLLTFSFESYTNVNSSSSHLCTQVYCIRKCILLSQSIYNFA